MKSLSIKATICILLLTIAVGAAFAGRIKCQEPLRVKDGQLLKSIYFFGHWWDPWKSNDAAVTADLKKLKDLGFNTICVDHEVSQAVDRDWYWLDREYKLAGQEKMYLLPWLQLQSSDRVNLTKFSHIDIKPAVNQDKQMEENSVQCQDPGFNRALAHYINVYLDRYNNDPALLKIQSGRKARPVVGMTVETGWRNDKGQPLSFDEETNAYFRKWMRASYHDINHLNSKWGTKYKSFDEIDPCDKTVFNYAFEDKNNVPPAVREHVMFRARLINAALQDVAKQVRKRHKDVILLAEIAYPFSVDNPDANAYRWNDANVAKAVEFADMVMIRTVGNVATGDVKKDQDNMILNGKPVILAYRIFGDCTAERAAAFAVDCASTASGIGCYNWNEVADNSSALYDKPDRQGFARLMNFTYDMLYDVDQRAQAPSRTETQPSAEKPAVPAAPETAPAPAPTAEQPAPAPAETTAESAQPAPEPEQLAPAPVPPAPAGGGK